MSNIFEDMLKDYIGPTPKTPEQGILASIEAIKKSAARIKKIEEATQ